MVGRPIRGSEIAGAALASGRKPRPFRIRRARRGRSSERQAGVFHDFREIIPYTEWVPVAFLEGFAPCRHAFPAEGGICSPAACYRMASAFSQDLKSCSSKH